MKYGALIGWGIAIYAVMFLLWSGFVLYGFVDGVAPRIVGLLVLIATTFVAARSLRFNSPTDIAPYSLSWVAIIVLLDILLSVPYTGWGLFSDWNVWVGYALVAIVPLLVPRMRSRVAVPDFHS